MERMFAADLARVPRRRDRDAVPADGVRGGRPALRHRTSPTLRFGLEIEDATELHARLGVRRVRERRGRPLPARAAGVLARRARGARGGREGVGREGARVPRLRRGAARSARRSRSSSPRTSSRRFRAEPGDDAALRRRRAAETSRVLGTLRLHLGRELGLSTRTRSRSSGSRDFPMFEWDEDEQRWTRRHHPFTRPTDEWETASTRTRATRSRTPTTSSSTATSSAAARSGSTSPSFRRGCSTARAHARGAAREVRLPARRARDGRAAARRDRVRDRPDDDGARRRAEPPRRDRVPEEPGRSRPDERRAVRGDAEQLDELGIRLVEQPPAQREPRRVVTLGRRAAGARPAAARLRAVALLAAVAAIAIVAQRADERRSAAAPTSAPGAGRLVRRASPARAARRRRGAHDVRQVLTDSRSASRIRCCPAARRSCSAPADSRCSPR